MGIARTVNMGLTRGAAPSQQDWRLVLFTTYGAWAAAAGREGERGIYNWGVRIQFLFIAVPTFPFPSPTALSLTF